MKIKISSVFMLAILFLALISSFAKADMQQVIDTTGNILSKSGEVLGAVCDNGNWFFRPLIGSECTQDLQFLVVFVLWIVFLFFMYDAIATYSAFSNLASMAIGFGLAVILANMGVISWLAEMIIALTTTPGGIAILIAVIIVLLIFYVIAKTMMTSEKKKKKEAKIKESEEVVQGMAEAIKKGVK